MDFWKSDAINTDNNNTVQSENNPINLSAGQSGTSRNDAARRQIGLIDRMDMVCAYRDIIKSNIDYDSLMISCPGSDREYIDEIVELLTETVGVERGAVNIAGVEYPCIPADMPV